MSGTLLFDANNAAMRAIHAMSRSGLSVDGIPTGPLLAIINTLSKHVKEEQPDRVVVCWDGGRSAYRLGIDADYKAHRLTAPSTLEEAKHSTFALAKEFCSLAGLHHVERPGVEADDLIAYYVLNGSGRMVIVSSDKDFLQLLHEGRVEQVRLSSSGVETDRWTRDRVVTEMRCEPHDLPYAMALAGDISDNVPGVPRFGMKTAVKALEQTDWDWEVLLRQDSRVRGYENRVRRNLALVDLREGLVGLHLPALPWFQPTSPGEALFSDLVSFVNQYQLRSVQSRIYDGTLWK